MEASETQAILETPAKCDIKIDNKVVSQEFQTNIIDVRLSQYIDDHHELRVLMDQEVFVDPSGKSSDNFVSSSGLTSFLGKSISARFTPFGGYVDDSKSGEFIGTVTEVGYDNSIDGRNMGIIIAHSPTIGMDGAERNFQFKDVTASDVIGTILGNHPITKGNIESTSNIYKYINQYNETDFDFIHRLAGLESLFAYYDGKEFLLQKASGSSPEELSWNETLGAFRVGVGTASHEYTSKSYDYLGDKEFSQDSSDLSLESSLDSISKKAEEASKEIFKNSAYTNKPRIVDSASTLDKNLQAERNRAMGSMVKCFGQSNVPAIRVGHPISVKGLGGLDGPYWVKAVKHVLEAGKYHNTFTCSPVDIAYPERQPSSKLFDESSKSIDEQKLVPPNPKSEDRNIIHGLHRAIVINNVDPEALNRIQVQFAWAPEDTPWVRMAVPYASQEFGWSSVPEIGDEVLVGFEFGDPDYPVAIGGLYSNKNKPPADTGTDGNNIKTFITRSGHKLEFDDSDGSEKLSIICAQENNQIILDASGPSVTIESSNGTITLKAANINLEADQELKYKAGTMVNLEGVNITIKASGMLNLEGGTTTVKGTPIQLN